MSIADEISKQRQYYAETADAYDSMHAADEVEFAMRLLDGFLYRSQFTSMLDVGSGTGRTLAQLQRDHSDIRRIVGLEPSAALRAKGSGLQGVELIDGDAMRLSFEDDEFDIVTEFAALHHIPDPRLATSEMVRVARHAVFFCDGNNWGQGSAVSRLVKIVLRSLGLWKVYLWLESGGKMYKESPGDGIYYSFSLYDVLDIVEKKFPKIYIMSDKGAAKCSYLQSSGICILATR